MIELHNISKEYVLGKTKLLAVDNVSLKIKDGEFLSLIGPSGSGKTTLLNILGLLDTQTTGTFTLDGIQIDALNEKQKCRIRQEKLGFIFQTFNLIPVFNVYENIDVALSLSKHSLSKSQQKEKVYQVIEEVGLADHVKHKPAELSGGQQQRVAIARALVKESKYIIADEPTANLDTKTAFSILELMKSLNESKHITLIISTHDNRLLPYSSRVIELEDGKMKHNASGLLHAGQALHDFATT